MMVMSVATLIAFPILGVMLDRWGRVPTMILALISGAIAMFLLAASPNPFSPLVYGAMLWWGWRGQSQGPTPWLLMHHPRVWGFNSEGTVRMIRVPLLR